MTGEYRDIIRFPNRAHHGDDVAVLLAPALQADKNHFVSGARDLEVQFLSRQSSLSTSGATASGIVPEGLYCEGAVLPATVVQLQVLPVKSFRQETLTCT